MNSMEYVNAMQKLQHASNSMNRDFFRDSLSILLYSVLSFCFNHVLLDISLIVNTYIPKLSSFTNMKETLRGSCIALAINKSR